MRKIKIVADSSSDILTLDGADYATAPLKIITADREFVDSPSLDVDEMIDYLAGYKGKSTTSCPSIGDWLEAFGDADEVFCITITSGLSGSYNSAMTAKQTYEADGSGKRVYVIDSLSTGPEIALMLRRLTELIAEDKSFDDICAEIEEYKKNTGLIFMLKSLKTLANNGRVSPIIAKLVGIVGICIVGKASDVGTLEQKHKCRGEMRSLETLVSELEALGMKGGRVSIGHSRNAAAAEKLSDMIKAKFGEVDIEIHQLRGLCSFYAERGGLLVGFEKGRV